MLHTSDARPTAVWWEGPVAGDGDLSVAEALLSLGQPFGVVRRGDTLATVRGGNVALGPRPGRGWQPLLAWVPAVEPEDLGSAAFRAEHNLRYAYVVGAMANGIASPELVIAAGRAGMLGFYGAAGLGFDRVRDAVERISRELGDRPWGSNLIHSPYEPELEVAVARLYAERVRAVSASAYMSVTRPLVAYRVHGIHAAPDGTVVAPNKIFAKVSRTSVAAQFMAPPPAELLAELVGQGTITEAQAAMAATIPLAGDITVEADSGGHTDNQASLAQFPTVIALRDRIQRERGYDTPIRVGAAGGIGTPWSAAAAFSMGAAYVLTGSVNQACVEAGTSDIVRQMLAEATDGDVAMAPAADMFEMGVELQVLRRGTMFPMRAKRLYEAYRSNPSLDAIDANHRQALEKSVLGRSIDDIWADCQQFWSQRDPGQLERAAREPKHKMALVFRWYLGMSSRWANSGQAERRADFQVWCGPAMGAFNAWTAGTFLAEPEHRRAVTVAMNLMYGAALLSRRHLLTTQGVHLPPESLDLGPRKLAEIEALLSERPAS